MTRSGSLAGLRVLLVEDEALVALMAREILNDLGAAVVGTAHSFLEGMALARTAVVDIAILDVNLDGQTSYEIASALLERNIPVVFATGYRKIAFPSHARILLIEKPYTDAQLEQAILALMERENS